MVDSDLEQGPERLTGRQALRIHVGLALCLLICIPAFIFEITRALGGNALSWAYVFEWPIFIAFGVDMWRRLLEVQPSKAPTDAIDTPQDSAALVAWNDYLAQLAATDEPRDQRR
jgi:hypothetical protein